MSAGDSDPSTNSLLGRITRDLGIDQTSDINLDDVAEVIPDIANPTQVTDSETNIVYKLVADLPVDSDEIRELQKGQQLQKEIQLIKEENDANAVKVEADGKFRIVALASLNHKSVICEQLFLREVFIFRDDVPDNRFRAGEPASHEPAGAQLGHRQGRQRQDRRAREDSRAAGGKQAQIQVGRSADTYVHVLTLLTTCLNEPEIR